MSNLLILHHRKKDLRKLISFSVLIFGLSLISPAINLNFSYFDLNFLLFFFANALFYYISLFFFGLQTNSQKSIVVAASEFSVFILFLAVLILGCKLIDRFIVRPPNDIFSIGSYRASKEIGSNVFSVISAVFTPFVVLSYVIVIQFSEKRKLLRFILSSIVILFIADTFLSGSRGILLLMLISAFFHKIKPWHAPWLFLLAIVGFGFQFIYRFSQLQGLDIQSMSSSLESLSLDGYAHFVPVSSEFLELITVPFFGGAIFSFVQANQYFAHGIFEFAYIFSTQSISNMDPAQLIPQLGKIFETKAVAVRENLYYTLFGSAYLAFGAWSLLAMAAIGAFVGDLYQRAQSLSKNAIAVVKTSIFLAPFVNSFGGYDFPFFFLSIFVLSFVRLRNATLPVSE